QPSPQGNSRRRSWQRPLAPPTPQTRARGRRWKLFLVLAAILVLGAILVAVLLPIHPFTPPFLLTIPVTEYREQQLPVNALARADSDALCRCFAQPRQALDSPATRSLLEKELDSLRSHREDTVVVHLCALARTDAGQVYLLPRDADMDDPKTWLPLDRVLQALHDCPARHKVLLLDVARPSANPRLGILADDVAERARPLLEQAVAEDGSLWILCACGPGHV